MTQLLDRFEKKEKLRRIANRVYYEFEVTSNIFLKDIGLYAHAVCFSDYANRITAQTYMDIELVKLLVEICDAIQVGMVQQPDASLDNLPSL